MASVVLTWLIRRWALRVGFVDTPGGRKIHSKPVALGGGLTVFWVTVLPCVLVLIAALWFNRYGTGDFVPALLSRHIPGLISRTSELLTLIAAVTVLHILGLLDDIYSFGAMLKLVVQIAVALALATAGNIRFGFFIHNTIVTTVLSVLWLVAITNAFNFLDNMDGLSAGIGVICASIFLSVAWGGGQVFVSAMLVLLIGSLLGFLVFNFHPASIFLGDSGSLVTGLLLAVLSIQTTYYSQAHSTGSYYATLMPLIVLAVPIYDFVSVSILRISQGASPFVGDKQHFSHRLVARGMGQRQAVLTIYLATACTGLSATFLQQVSTAGVILIFLQTIMIICIIAILEQPQTRA